MCCSLCTAPLKSLFSKRAHHPPPKSIGTCSVPRLPGLCKMSATGTAHSCKGTRDDQLWPLICERRGRPIRGSIARTSRKSQAFMAWLLSFCLRLWQLLISSHPSPIPPHPARLHPAGPCCALNRLHFANGKLSSRTWQRGL